MQVGSYGYRWVLSTGLDLSQTTDMTLRMQRPDTVVVDRAITSSAITDAPRGLVEYVVQQSDFPQQGDYYCQLIDVTSGRWLPSAVFVVTALENLPGP